MTWSRVVEEQLLLSEGKFCNVDLQKVQPLLHVYSMTLIIMWYQRVCNCRQYCFDLVRSHQCSTAYTPLVLYHGLYTRDYSEQHDHPHCTWTCTCSLRCTCSLQCTCNLQCTCSYNLHVFYDVRVDVRVVYNIHVVYNIGVVYKVFYSKALLLHVPTTTCMCTVCK